MTPLVCVHGFMGGSQQWKTQRAALDPRMTICTVDLPGFGENSETDAPNKIRVYAQWVLDTVQKQGIERFHLLGHSMGGMIVQEMISLAPDRIDRLVLYGTGATGILPGRFEPIDTSKRRAQEDGAKATARRIAATWFLACEDSPAFEECATIAERTQLQAIVAGLDAMQDWSGVSNLPNIRSKTLVVWGDHDRTYPWSQTEQLWRTIEGASLAVIPNCAHAAHLEKPDLFNGIVSDFLSS